MCDYFQDEVATRGGKKVLDDKRGIFNLEIDNKIHRSRLRLQRWLLGLLIFLFISLIVINTYSTDQFRTMRYGTLFNDTLQEKLNNAGFLVHNKGCRIPAMDPYDVAIKRFIRKEDPIVCEHGDHLPLVESNDTSLFVNPAAISHFYNKSEEVDCCWRPFWRTKDEDNAVTYDNDCFKFHNSTTINTEFVKVECSRNNELIYKDYHVFLPRNSALEERCEKARASNPKRKPLGLLIIGIDSVSRINFHRMMPNTVQALQQLAAVEMLGYTKVADNTYPNLVPVLTGLTEGELRDQCWQTKDKPFDDCPFIWKNFSAAGYRTAFGEDACSITTFNYLKPGFRVQPTDYYLRPFCIASEKNIGNTHRLNANLCVGTRKTFDNLLHYARKAASQFPRDPYFAMVWQSSLTHDFFNYPQLGDQSYYNLITYLSSQRLLDQTALIVMSDHGMRWGSFRETYQGRMEDSLPFVFIVLPDWWKERYQVAWANLRRNARSLTTAFDLHETLLDLLYSENLEESRLKSRFHLMSKGDSLPRGISWFLPIPDHRSCTMAGIASHWCMCHDSKDVDLKDDRLKDKAAFLVSKLNEMLKKFAQCAVLKLKEVKGAKEWRNTGDGSELVDYTITLQTEPGNAIFEGTVRYRSSDKSNKLVGSVSRLNAYGKQSACVDEFNMRLYCYCL
ncbi:uncharacterized protein LOC114883158 [Osmia bicornis bicornis]|uniref:uncharacterized protein LOC114883158 n=1 Tax=Osmia bicornis bicornis TaxID=1437191 RepID=UPI0010F7C320|nr:uncharacterized protein LOC114883158 [Osmia bicornis bicornis]XP_029056504.1 uncharacterized protein LOC114883158 [Osmia bicornis bicornis]XP_029056505.1 uncharacterized protein LOC114883158 [Osmia bicornis bicornis]XP_029056507.1 uncharacterized protein LOC114883158 [Osmia bicornis bicornis]